MKIKVTNRFRDIVTGLIHQPGEEIEVTPERGANIISLKLGEEIKEKDETLEKTADKVAEEPKATESLPDTPSIFDEPTGEDVKPKAKSKRGKKNPAE